MKVSRVQIIGRGLANRCPNCGGRTLFRPGTLFELDRQCRACGLKLERDEGFFLGSLSLNYGVTVVGFLLPVLLLWRAGLLGGTAAAVVAGAGALGVPVLFYRSSRSWWLMCYYYFLPHHLPANRPGPAAGEDGNT